MENKKQSMVEIDELHNSILSLCSEESICMQNDECDEEPDGDFINSLIEYSPDDTTQVFIVSPRKDGKKNCESRFDISSIPSSPALQTSCSLNKSPVKRSNPDTLFDDELNISSILNSPIQCKNVTHKPLLKHVVSQSTPLVAGFKGTFKASIKAQSTPLNFMSQKDVCSVLTKTRQNLFKEDFLNDLGVIDEEDNDPTVTFEDLLSDLTSLISDGKDKELPAKLKSEDLQLLSTIKPENQISRIDLDSILLQNTNKRGDDINGSNSSISSNISCGKPGRFTTLNATVRTTVIEEVDEEGDDVEDILGLDDYIYSGMIEGEDDELSSDEEKTLLFDDLALCKTILGNKSRVDEESKNDKNTTVSYRTVGSVVGFDTVVGESGMKVDTNLSPSLYRTVGSVVGFDSTCSKSPLKRDDGISPSSFRRVRSSPGHENFDNHYMMKKKDSIIIVSDDDNDELDLTKEEAMDLDQIKKEEESGPDMKKTEQETVCVLTKPSEISSNIKTDISDEEKETKNILKNDQKTADQKGVAAVILTRDDKNTCKVSPVKVDLEDKSRDMSRASIIISEGEVKPAISKELPVPEVGKSVPQVGKSADNVGKSVGQSVDNAGKLVDNVPQFEQEYVENENELMRDVVRRWKSKGIPKPDTNLTYANWARKKLGLIKGHLEGQHLSTLNNTKDTKKTRDESGQPPSKKQRTGSVVPMPNIKANLEAQIEELIAIEHCNAEEILKQGKKVIINLKNEEDHRIRLLYMQQQLEIRQLVSQFRTFNVNEAFFNLQMLQLRQEHDLQKNRIKCFFNEQIQDREKFYFEMVSKRNEQYTQRKEQLNCLLKQLENQPKLDQVSNPNGPRVTVDLVKGPCVTNNQTSSVVTVCLPADIAAAIIKEDEIYDVFYIHPKLSKKDYYIKKK